MLLGRQRERGLFDRLIKGARAGPSGALVLRGEAGIGKTALLDDLAARADGCAVARLAGAEAEANLAFAAVHQLCAPMTSAFDRIPEPQRHALERAIGRREGPPPDTFLVALAVLSLMAEVADERPLVCLVDDAQWLDGVSAQVLGVVARRLVAESVVMVFAVREPSVVPALTGLPELVVGGLGRVDARALLATTVPGPLDADVRERIVAETRGNPLALLELPAGLPLAELAGGFGVPTASALSRRIEDSFRRRFATLADETRRLLVVAAAEPVGDAALLWRSAELLDIEVSGGTLEPAADLVRIGAKVRFRHPLVRSAIYWTAPASERRSAHLALAEATDAQMDPDRRAWHRAQATGVPDEDLAMELERSASRAQARGGLAAAAAFLERSTALTSDPVRRASRAIAAAQAKHDAGAPDAALALLDLAAAGPLNDLDAARADLLRGEIAFTTNRGVDAPRLLLRAAAQLQAVDVGMARDTYLQALSAALFVGRLNTGDGATVVANAARAVLRPTDSTRVADLLLDGLVLLFTGRRGEGLKALRAAVDAFAGTEVTMTEQFRWLWLGSVATAELWDDGARHRLALRYLQVARESGALSVLPLALSQRFIVCLHAGELAQAAVLEEEARALSAAMGIRLAPYGALALAAWRGQRAATLSLIESSTAEATARGEGMGLTVAHWAGAVLHNGLGEYEAALAQAQLAVAHLDDPGGATVWALAELVEAAVRVGRPDLADDALRQLIARTAPAATDWSLGVEARTRALLDGDGATDELYRESVERLERTTVRVELARTHLLYGEWLRGQRRRLDARAQLLVAHDLFAEMGIEGFADRAARELLATGAKARERRAESSNQLTAQEAQVAQMARDHLSNPEIGARLFMSPRTVEYHLRKVFVKLDITSRNQLAEALRGLSQPEKGRPS